MLHIKNYTGRLQLAEHFLRAKCNLVRTRGLSIHIKYTREFDAEINGYYRWDDRRMVVAVQPGLRYPFKAAYSVAYAGPRRRVPVRRQPIWHEEHFKSADDFLVFVAGHEMWHYLCHTRQRRGDEETTANCHGFAWLREFRRWHGPSQSVEPIPEEPPRPDLFVVPSRYSRRVAALASSHPNGTARAIAAAASRLPGRGEDARAHAKTRAAAARPRRGRARTGSARKK